MEYVRPTHTDFIWFVCRKQKFAKIFCVCIIIFLFKRVISLFWIYCTLKAQSIFHLYHSKIYKICCFPTFNEIFRICYSTFKFCKLEYMFDICDGHKLSGPLSGPLSGHLANHWPCCHDKFSGPVAISQVRFDVPLEYWVWCNDMTQPLCTILLSLKFLFPFLVKGNTLWILRRCCGSSLER